MRRCGVSWKRNSLHSWQENVINRGLSYCHLLWKKKKKKEVKRPEQSAMKGPLFFCIILCLYWSLFPVSTGTLVLFIYNVYWHALSNKTTLYLPPTSASETSELHTWPDHESAWLYLETTWRNFELNVFFKRNSFKNLNHSAFVWTTIFDVKGSLFVSLELLFVSIPPLTRTDAYFFRNLKF